MTSHTADLPTRYRYREEGRELERERILKLIEDNFYPLDYARWQADELLDELVRLIKGDAE